MKLVYVITILCMLPLVSGFEYEATGTQDSLNIFTESTITPDDLSFSWRIDGSYTSATPTINGVLLPDGRRQYRFTDRPENENGMQMRFGRDTILVRTDYHDGECSFQDLQTEESSDCTSLTTSVPGQERLFFRGAYYFIDGQELVIDIYKATGSTISLENFDVILEYGTQITSAGDTLLEAGDSGTIHITGRSYEELCGQGIQIGIYNRQTNTASASGTVGLRCQEYKPVCEDKVCSELEEQLQTPFACEADCDDPISLEVEYRPAGLFFSASAATDDCSYMLLDEASQVVLREEVQESSAPLRLDNREAWSKQEMAQLGNQEHTFRFECRINGVSRYLQEQTVALCAGCMENGQCLEPLSRTDSGFCDAQGTYTELRADGELCESNLYCESGRCSQQVCAKQTILYRIGQWFARLF